MNVWTDAANALAEQRTSPTQRRDLTMRPTSILDPRFRYVPSNCTDVTVTWRRFGFTPQRNAERPGQSAGSSDPHQKFRLRLSASLLLAPHLPPPIDPLFESPSGKVQLQHHESLRDGQYLRTNSKNSKDEVGVHAYLRSQDIAAERAGG
jgi:hypothetical protein